MHTTHCHSSCCCDFMFMWLFILPYVRSFLFYLSKCTALHFERHFLSFFQMCRTCVLQFALQFALELGLLLKLPALRFLPLPRGFRQDAPTSRTPGEVLTDDCLMAGSRVTSHSAPEGVLLFSRSISSTISKTLLLEKESPYLYNNVTL